MGKNIVVITGSPRKGGNSSAMVDAFTAAAEELGHEVTRFDAALSNVGGCRACETCFQSGKPCTYDDDFNTIAPAILKADGIVFAAPVCWYSFPGQIKNTIGRRSKSIDLFGYIRCNVVRRERSLSGPLLLWFMGFSAWRIRTTYRSCPRFRNRPPVICILTGAMNSC